MSAVALAVIVALAPPTLYIQGAMPPSLPMAFVPAAPPIELPELKLIPPGLPEAARQADGSWVLPADLALETSLFLLRCVDYPALVRRSIEARDAAWQEALALSTRTQRAHLEAAFASELSSTWRWWEVALFVGASAIGAAIVGFSAGYLVGMR